MLRTSGEIFLLDGNVWDAGEGLGLVGEETGVDEVEDGVLGHS